MSQFKAAQEGDLQQLRAALTVDNMNEVDGGWTVLHNAASFGSVDCAKYCVEMGANVNARDSGGLTPLHIASWRGHVNVVRVLLDGGAVVDSTNNGGCTPLHDAIRFKRVDVGRLLVDRGAKMSNVKLSKWVQAIPDWLTTLIDLKSKCRCVAIIIIGMHKYRRNNVTGDNDINVIRLISKHIWSTRMDAVWATY
jgi:ankyrin repeat protein